MSEICFWYGFDRVMLFVVQSRLFFDSCLFMIVHVWFEGTYLEGRSRLVKHERDSFGVTFQNRTENRTFSIKLSSIRMFGRSMTKNKLYFYILDVSGRISSSYPYRTVLSVYGRAAAAIYQRTICSGQYWYKYTEMVLVLLLLNQNDNSVFSLWTLNIQLYFDKAVKRYDRGWPRWGTAGWVRPHTS